MNTYVEVCMASAVQEMEMFLRNFSKVPDDRLNWTIAPNAKSPLRIAAHTALYAGRFAAMMRERALPKPENMAAWLAKREAEEAAVISREAMEEIFRAGTAEVLAVLESLTDEDLAVTLDSGQGWTMPLSHLAKLPGWHATLHCGQIDFLQTCWGDTEIYVG